MKILFLNAGNAVKRFLKKIAIPTYVILLLILAFFLFNYPQSNKIIAALTFLSGLVILATYFKIKTYIELKASSKSDAKCEVKYKDE